MKKGDISLNYVVVAAIALVVLVVIIIFFMGGLQTLFQRQKEAVSSVTDQQLEIWRGQCKLYCSLGQKENFEKKVFESGDTKITCSELKVECGLCAGTLSANPGSTQPCSQRGKGTCSKDGCTWTDW